MLTIAKSKHIENSLEKLSNLLAITVVVFAIFAVQSLAHAQSKQEIINKITEHFSSVPTMHGEFIQFSENGGQVGGKFYLQRPGKIRFNYEPPYPIQMISNGKSIVINNKKLKTWDIYPLSKTPLKLLLDDKISLNNKAIKSIKTEGDLITLELGDKSIFGDSNITLMFDAKNYELRQWNIIDNQGKETSVLIFNVEKNAKLSKKLFHINFQRIRMLQEDQRNKGR
jgi:outer membrane lipoprotein-sorting protein